MTFAEQHQCCDVYLSMEDGSGSSSSWFTGLYMKRKKGEGGETARKQEQDGKGTGNRYMARFDRLQEFEHRTFDGSSLVIRLVHEAGASHWSLATGSGGVELLRAQEGTPEQCPDQA